MAAEVDPALHEMLRTLQEARQAVRAELEAVGRADQLDVALFRRLYGATAELAGQAALLAMMMQGPDEDAAMVKEAQRLSSFFRLTMDQFGSLLGAGQE